MGENETSERTSRWPHARATLAKMSLSRMQWSDHPRAKDVGSLVGSQVKYSIRLTVIKKLKKVDIRRGSA